MGSEIKHYNKATQQLITQPFSLGNDINADAYYFCGITFNVSKGAITSDLSKS